MDEEEVMQRLQALNENQNVNETNSFSQGFNDMADSDLIRFQLDLGPEIGNIIEQLNMFEANDELKKQIIIVLKSVVNRNVYLSNYDQATMNISAEDAEQVLNDALFEYGTDLTFSQRGSILNACVNLVESSLRRPLNQGERGFLGKTTESKQIVQHRANENKGFTLSGMFGRGKR
jgi:hypothetical protein